VPLTRVIAGTSGSPGSLAALRYAECLARALDVILVPVLAWELPGSDGAGTLQPLGDLGPECHETACRRMREALLAVWGEDPHDPLVRPWVQLGPPGPVLVSLACRPGDVLVVGAGRRDPLRRIARPPVSRYCVAHARCPVVLVPPPELRRQGGLRRLTWQLTRRSVTPEQIIGDRGPAARRLGSRQYPPPGVGAARTGLSWNDVPSTRFGDGPGLQDPAGLATERDPGLDDTRVHQLSRQDFEHLLAFRTSLRQFQRWSEDQARAAGLTHVQHQLLVAIKGHPGTEPPAVGDLSGYLLQRHHSTVELVDRAEAAGLVRRVADGRDARVVRVQLTAQGDRVLNELTPAHLVELHNLAAILDELVEGAGA
jgi:DNA-binding MarR family transcriptional regulator/nucleotide-binding universal stress UspA family protein